MSRRSRILLGVFIAAVILGLATPVVSMTMLTIFYVPDALVGSLWLLAAIAMVLFCCSLMLERGKVRGLLWCGMAVTVIAGSVWIALMWQQVRQNGLLGWTCLGAALSPFSLAIMLIGILVQLRI